MTMPHPPSGSFFWARMAWRYARELPSAIKRETPKTWGAAHEFGMKLAIRARPVTWKIKRNARERVVVPCINGVTRGTKAAASFLESLQRKPPSAKRAFDYVAPKGEPLVPYKGVALKKPLNFTAPTPPKTPTTPAIDKKTDAVRATVQRRARTKDTPKPTQAPTKRK
jgi:hypothetical protein